MILCIVIIAENRWATIPDSAAIAARICAKERASTSKAELTRRTDRARRRKRATNLFGFNAQNGGQQGNGGYNAPPPQYTRYTDPDDRRSVGFGVLGFFIPLVGFILWLVWRDSMPQRARSCAIGALVGVIVYVIFVIISVALSLTFAADIFEEYYYYYSY